jgi:hypothetical protein
MRITITATQSEAIKMGRDATTWGTEIDISTLSPAQRECLTGYIRIDGVPAHSRIIGADGEISAQTIQAYLDATEAERVEHEKTVRARNREGLDKNKNAVETYLTGGDRPGLSPYSYHGSGSELDAAEQAEHDALVALRDAEDARRAEAKKIEDEKKHAKNIAQARDLIERDGPDAVLWYNNGWRLKYTCLDNTDLMPAITARIAELEKSGIKMDMKKYHQLSDYVQRIGTETQKLRWAEHVMPVAEAISLVITEATAPLTAAGYVVLSSEDYHLSPDEEDEAGNTPDVSESDKKTLTDEQFLSAKKIRDLMAGWDYAYYSQHYQQDDETISATYIRLCKKIGMLAISIDVAI